MDSSNLTREQLQQLQVSIGRQLGYLNRLRNRMMQRGFPQNDRLWQDVHRAFCAMDALSVQLFYMTCAKGSVGF